MRILHTSDWHVGRTIRGRSRAAEHRAVLAEIVAHAHDQQPDLIAIAGDLFDTAAPSAEAEAIVYETLLHLAETQAHVVIVTGNHDNARRWSAVRPLLELTNVHVADRVLPPDAGGVLDLRGRDGTTARVALLPWQSQRSVIRAEALMGGDPADHASTFTDRVRGIVAALTADFGPDTVNLVIGHLTVAATGQRPTHEGSERSTHILGPYVVPPQVFPETCHHVALGHLHLPHRVPGPAPTWYAGSPLALDFGEAERAHKSVLLVDVPDPSQPATVRELPLTAGRGLVTLRGTVDEVVAAAGEHGTGTRWSRVQVTEPHRVGLADEVRAAIPDAVDVQVLDPARDDEVPDTPDLATVHGSPQELFAEYCVEHGIDDPALLGLFATLLDEELSGDDEDDRDAAPEADGDGEAA